MPKKELLGRGDACAGSPGRAERKAKDRSTSGGSAQARRRFRSLVNGNSFLVAEGANTEIILGVPCPDKSSYVEAWGKARKASKLLTDVL